jgi:hypothetical protein
VAAREAAIVVVIRDRNPPLVALTLDEGVARLLLGIDGVEGLVQTLVARHAAVHRAALGRNR